MSQWILLRGLTREAEHWGAFETALAAHGLIGAGERAVCIDLPGNGVEHAQEAPSSVEAMTDFVRARAAALNVRAPYRVIAMSLGAMAATAWAQRHPGEIERLVLINTSMRPFARVHERLRPASWPTLVRIAMNWSKPERCEALIHRLTCNRSDAFDADIAHWARLRRARCERDERCAATRGGGAFSRASRCAALSGAAACVGGRQTRRSGMFPPHCAAVARVACGASVGRTRSAARRRGLDVPDHRSMARRRSSDDACV